MTKKYYTKGQPLTAPGLFQLVCEEALKDGQMEEWERTLLTNLARIHGIDQQLFDEIVATTRDRFARAHVTIDGALDPGSLYRRVLRYALSDGLIDADEAESLAGLRRLLGLPEKAHREMLAALTSSVAETSMLAEAEMSTGSLNPAAEMQAHPGAPPTNESRGGSAAMRQRLMDQLADHLRRQDLAGSWEAYERLRCAQADEPAPAPQRELARSLSQLLIIAALRPDGATQGWVAAATDELLGLASRWPMESHIGHSFAGSCGAAALLACERRDPDRTRRILEQAGQFARGPLVTEEPLALELLESACTFCAALVGSGFNGSRSALEALTAVVRVISRATPRSTRSRGARERFARTIGVELDFLD